MLRLGSSILLLILAGCHPSGESKAMDYNQLSDEEARVMLHKGTEAPFSGIYTDHDATGAYACKQCDSLLFESTDKFKSGCGWPSFDDAIPEAVRRVPDADGRRTEILCARCGGHLGHVFQGEGLTEKNTRYCVNSISLNFVKQVQGSQAIFAGGCFWGVEHYFKEIPGVLETTVGYIGGKTAHPSYQEVCAKGSGHAEALQVIYDPARVSFEELARLFFEIHDPTQVNRQGPDVGDQYRSAIFFLDEDQRRTSEKLIAILEAQGLDVATELVKAGRFWPAEDYHQDYYTRTGKKPYCHVRSKRFPDEGATHQENKSI